MSEAEDVLLEGAYSAASYVQRLWRRNRVGPKRVELADVRRRLELLVGAYHLNAPAIVVAEPLSPPSLFARLFLRIPSHMVDLRPLAGTDGVKIRLPRAVNADDGDEAATSVYRVLALQQTARAVRGTPRLLEPELEPVVRDLYLLAEAVAVDASLASEFPGVVSSLVEGRAASLEDRPRLKLLLPRELEVERRIRAALESAPGEPPDLVPLAESPEASLAWAKGEALALATLEGRYRGIPLVPIWGRTTPTPVQGRLRDSGPGGEASEKVAPERVRTMKRRPKEREAPEDEDDEGMGMWMIQMDDPLEHTEDPMGLQRPTDRDTEADPGDLADSLSELPEARLVSSPGNPTEVLVSEDPPDSQPASASSQPTGAGIAYPEWDYRKGAYHPAYAIVRESEAVAGDLSWSTTTLKKHAREVRLIRRRFERLRPQRLRLGRQPDGDDVDLEAYVNSYADVRAGCPPDDRLYETVRPTRRSIAIGLLVDVSGSTDSWVGGQRRIIDVEKEALLLVCEALDALGDRYGVMAFSGEGPEAVSVQRVKTFEERYSESVRRRIAGLEPDRYTRSGTAIRHATASLMREQARHRLLLILSDGKPNDVDQYEGRYGIEDTRQAVAEARLQGLHPYCLTVDRSAPTYISRIFGPGSYAVLRDPATLPQVLVEVVRRLVTT